MTKHGQQDRRPERNIERAGWAGAAALLLGVAACGGAASTGLGQPPRPETHSLQLRAFSSCGALEKFIEDRVVEEMKVAIENNLRSGLNFAEGGNVGAPAVPGAGDTGGGRGSIGRTAGPAAYTTTNVQTEGVDEADFVKNDGKRIFVLSGQRLYVTRSWPAGDLALTSGLAIEGQPSEMFLDEKNRVVVMSRVYDPAPGGTEPGGTGERPAAGAALPCPIGGDAIGGGAYPGCAQGPARTKLTIVDVTNQAAPAEIAAYYLPGEYAHARRVGASVRVVLTDYLPTPSDLRYYPETTDSTLYQDKARLRAAMDALIVRNETIIRGRALSDWIRTPRLRRAGPVVDLGYRCEDFNWSSAYTRSGLVTVATLNLDAIDDGVARTVVLADPGIVYASKDALYLATPHWWWWPEAGQTDLTYVYKFDTTDPSRAAFTAAGFLEGHPLNQFSMDEHQGFLRAAITARSYRQQRSGSTVSLTQTTVNRVVVLRETASDVLSVWGQTEDLAPGETIHSARFLGTRGFVVTFRQVDPLFTIDLRDPAKPRRIGELKVPGFSTYLHPLGDNHLLAIGVHVPDPTGSGDGSGGGTEPAPPPSTGGDVAPPSTGAGGSSGSTGSGTITPGTVERALKLTIFDVTDFANPVEAHTVTVGTSASQSEALYEHKAFNYFAAKGLLAIPFADYAATRDGGAAYWDSFVSELRVFKVDAVTGIQPVGAVSMKDVFRAVDDAVYADGKVAPGVPVTWPAYYTPWIRRSVMATDTAGNDYVYAISDAGIRVASGAALAEPLATALFPLQGY